MSENMAYLHGRPSPIRHFLRVGTTGHGQLETILGVLDDLGRTVDGALRATAPVRSLAMRPRAGFAQG